MIIFHSEFQTRPQNHEHNFENVILFFMLPRRIASNLCETSQAKIEIHVFYMAIDKPIYADLMFLSGDPRWPQVV